MEDKPQFTGVQPLRPPTVGSVGPPQSFVPPMSIQFRPLFPAQLSQPFIPVASQQFQPVGRGVSAMNIGLPSQTQQLQFSQPMQQLPARPGQPGHGPPPSQAIPMLNVQPNRSNTSGSPQPQQTSQIPNNYTPGLGGSGIPLSSSYTFAPSSYGQLQINVNATTQYQPISQPNAASILAGGQSWLSTGNQSTASINTVRDNGEQASVTTFTVPATSAQPNFIERAPSDWLEHTSVDGRRYYYNKKTRQSSWEKPLELMTPIERADASTDWKEFTSPEGRKYYYNKVTKQSKWTIPEELKLAREQAEKTFIKGTPPEMVGNSHAPAAVSLSVVKTPSNADTSSSTSHGVASSPLPVAPVVAVINPQPVVISGSSSLPVVASTATTNSVGVQSPVETVTPVAAVSESAGVPLAMTNTIMAPMSNLKNSSAQVVVNSVDGSSARDIEEAEKGAGVAGKINVIASEEKTVDLESLNYANKLEAKNAFKALLESANVESDWTWDQAMRVIINDRRYGALKTLGERKQAFNEFLGQRKKQDAEERRAKQKKAREEFKKMLEDSTELTSSTRWSKAITMFEDDERFKAVERARDREDLFESFTAEVEKKERAKALEEHKRNIMEYKQFLESCDFIKASSQWRKVQVRLEADERCSRLEKLVRLEIFQEYLRDLEKEEEEERRIQKEELRKAERKSRDEFRKLMEGHVAAGALTAKTHWRDYFMKVKDLPAYLAVSSNTSGSTPKDLFEDVAEELQKQYHEDKTRIKDTVKLGKITLSSMWTLEDFNAAISEDVSSPPISDINLRLVFDELQERVREKEEKEAKKRKRLADDFFDLLCSIKEITASSKWEDCKPLLEESQKCRSIEEESFCREIFEGYITQLKEKAKENERKRKEERAKKEKEREEREKRKVKQRREKERGHEREKGEERSKKNGTDSENADITEIHVLKEDKGSGKDKDKKHRKRRRSADGDMSLDKNEKDRSKNFKRHSSDRKKKRQMEQHEFIPESDSESRRKRHKRDHRNGSRTNGHYDDLEDGELG